MRILVAGGGISGCIASLLTAEAGHQVTLCEASSSLGGVLQDHLLPEGSWFRNCQYIDVGEAWSEFLLGLDRRAFRTFPHRYGSWNNLYGSPVVRDDFAQVVVPNAKAEVLGGQSVFSSVFDRLSRYSESTARPLCDWASQWGNLERLAPSNCDMMQIGRVFFSDDVEGTRRAKVANKVSDDLLGIPRSIIEPESPTSLAALPRDGWSATFRMLGEALRRRSVSVRVGCRVSLRVHRGAIVVQFDSTMHEYDLVVWCANPTLVAHEFGVGALDSPASSMVNFLCRVEGRLPFEPMYWQVFSQTSPIVRIFTYRLGGQPRATIEAFETRVPSGEVVRQAEAILEDCAVNVKMQSVARKRDLRHVLVSVEDQGRFDAMRLAGVNESFVPGGWHEYGRNRRIGSILASLKELAVL